MRVPVPVWVEVGVTLLVGLCAALSVAYSDLDTAKEGVWQDVEETERVGDTVLEAVGQVL